MQSDRQNLTNVKLLSGLDPEELRPLEERCTWRRYNAGQRVFERGTEGDDVIFVIEGALSIVSPTPSGGQFNFATANAGATVGELSAIDGQPRTASVVAAEDSLLAILPSERFVDLLKGHGEIAFRLMGMLAAIIRRGNELVVESGTGEAINRIYTELLRLAEPDPKSQDLLIVDPLPSLRDLANQTGTTRELVASALNRLYPENIVRRKGRSLYIIDPEALRRAVDPA